jgi:LuxR family maltose regulon positive regulatory protein
MPLLTTKLHIPAPCPYLVPRPRLLMHLSDGLKLGHKLTLLSAPAGFGKTNLLSEWAACADVSKRVAWLSLDSEDNSSTRFWAYVISALQTVLEEVGETTATLLRSTDPPSIEVILTPLLNEIASQPERVVLILDDYHLISRDEIHGGITFLMDHLPSQLHLVIATRADPPLPIVRMRARGQLTELRGDDLRFTYEEARNFLISQMGLELTESDLKALDMRIEGWIAGLQLAAISMRGWINKQKFIHSIIDSPYYILEFLIEEVLKHLPEEVLHFLFQTSILTQLCASLCNRVTDRSDSAAMLARLYHENLFVTALDYDHTWYRYHRLFADLLKNRLQQQLDKQAVADLHQRASYWYEEQGYLQIAVKHALEAGDMERVATLAEQATQFSLIDSWMTNLLEWLELLPENLLRSRLRLRIYQACALFFDGQTTRCMNVLEETHQAIQQLTPSPENNALQGELSRLIEIVHAFIDVLALSMQGKLEQSSQVLLQIKPLVEEAGNVLLSAHALEGLALNQYHQGKLRAAASTSEQLIELAGGSLRETHPGQPLPIATTGYLLLANIYLDQNRLEEMAQFLARAFELCRKSGGAKSLVEIHVMQSRLQQAQGDLDSAYQSLTKAERAYPLKGLVTRFRLESQKARLNVEAGALEDVIRWMKGLGTTDSETKSLAPLPPLLYEVSQLIQARLYLARYKPEKTLRILEQIQKSAEVEGRNRHVIEIYTLKALAFHMLDQSESALAYMEQALRLAEGEDIGRVFLDGVFLEKGVPMQRLLYQIAEREVLPAFTGRLLVAFPQVVKDMHKSGVELFEPLSKREIEVLEHLARGLSNHQIAQQLVISLYTVKTHTGNIYRKLGVNNRIQAGIKAKALGVIKQ